MELVLVKTLAALVLPPGGNFVLGVAGLVLWRRMRLLAFVLVAVAVGSLYLFSTTPVSDALYAVAERYPPRLPGAAVPADAGAIVVLAGGRASNAREYGGDTVSEATLVRLRYGARLYRETGLPLILSGGRVYGEARSEAELMRDVLEDEIRVPVWKLEERSRNTAENARHTAELLAGESIAAILLVTEAIHMARAVAVFENAGVRVYPAPTMFRVDSNAARSWRGWLPSAKALARSHAALHELLGDVWYRIRY